MAVLGIFMCILYLLIIPFCIGTALIGRLKSKYNTIGNILTFGFLSELAVFQILFLAVYFFDRDFYFLSKISMIALLAVAAISLPFGLKNIKKIELPKFDIGLGIFALFTIYMMVLRNLQGVNDGDDAFVLGNALMTVTTGFFYKNDYYTGFAMSSTGYMRHLLASNTIFIAFLSKQSMIHPTILARRVLGCYYILLHNMILYNIGKSLFKKKESFYIGFFASFVSLITIWDFHSYLNDSTFILSRTWQGKSMFCSLCVPACILISLIIGAEDEEKEDKKEKKKLITSLAPYVFVFILSIASVAMTPAAIYLLSIMMMVLITGVAIVKKNFPAFLLTCAGLLPLVAFAILYYLKLRV